MNVSIITVGDELLIGQVIDTNSAWMGKKLNELGFSLTEILSVSDEHFAIIDALYREFERSDIILMTGGLGPTKDDVTKKAIADFFKVPMVFHDETYERILKMFSRRNIPLSDSHKDQCYMPQNAKILNNDMGTAPGMWFEKDGKILVSMPGVPFEMKHLMETKVLPDMKQLYQGPPILHLTIRTCGLGESTIADKIKDIEDHLPDGVKLAYLPDIAQVRLRYTISGKSQSEMESVLDDLKERTYKILEDNIYGYGEAELEEVIGQILIQKNKKLITCESCTGGYLSHRITSVPGSSVYFMGSFVSYAYDFKTKVLNVKQSTLDKYGAVSEDTVSEMIKGGLAKTDADIAISISGIAGPGGGTSDKPVGTVWIAVGNSKKIVAKKHLFTKDRIRNIQYSATYALIMLREFLLNEV